MLSEIGSSFWINPEKQYSGDVILTPEIFNIKCKAFEWLSSGRSAITAAVEDALGKNPNMKKTVLLPAYTCESVIEPFLKKGFDTEFFCIDESMRVDAESVISLLKKTKASFFLFHTYFGFNTFTDINKVTDFCINQKVCVIEDRTQCLYSGIPISNADYIVGSIRKWCEVPDGGFVACARGELTENFFEKDATAEKVKLTASYKKFDYLFNGTGEKEEFLALYSQAEDLLEKQNKIYSIADSSYAIQGALDTDELKRKRRENYLFLSASLNSIHGIKILFPDLPGGVTPLFMPIIVEDRQRLRDLLKNERIYAPVIWPKPDAVGECTPHTQYLYDSMLCIPIDQRYDCEDMHRIVQVLRR